MILYPAHLDSGLNHDQARVEMEDVLAVAYLDAVVRDCNTRYVPLTHGTGCGGRLGRPS